MGLDQQRQTTLANVSYTRQAFAEEAAPRIVHSTYAIDGFAFTNRLDLFSVVDPGQKALFVDVGMDKLCGHDHLDHVLAAAGLADATPDDARWEGTAAFITHFHDDHDQNLDYLVGRGLRVAYHGPVVPYSAERCDAFLRLSGAAREGDDGIAQPIAFLIGAERHSAQVQAVLTPAEEGQVLSFGGYDWEVVYTPGHTLEHACLLEREHKMLFAGDHVLRSAPGLMQFDPDSRLLVRYLDSIDQLDALGLERVFMCHTDTIEGPAAIHDALDAIRNSYVRPIRLVTNLMRAASTPGGYRAHNAQVHSTHAASTGAAASVAKLPLSAQAPSGSSASSTSSASSASMASPTCAHPAQPQVPAAFELWEVAPLYGEVVDLVAGASSGHERSDHGWLSAYDLAKAYYAYLEDGFAAQSDLQRARRTSVAFSYLEYLHDQGVLDRRTASDDTLEYRIRPCA